MVDEETRRSEDPLDPELLSILCCPETKQALTLATRDILGTLNQKIEQGALNNRAGHPVQGALDAGLVRDDGKILYPIRDRIPIMLIDEGIVLDV